ncbi:MAG: glycosyltransferase [Agriterribacter sp.]
MFIFLVAMALLAGYGFLIRYYYKAWRAIPAFNDDASDSFVPSEKITVIIPARNEEAVIEQCIQSLLLQTYPRHLLEIIVVDDHSTDRTAVIVAKYNAQGVILINLAEALAQQQFVKAYKKKAIEVAIGRASGTLIVTTDADCIAGAEWIKTLAAFHARSKAVFIAAPVKIAYNNRSLSTFQAMDFAILQGITAASVSKKFHSMCNGANLAYEKQVFYAVNGFDGIDDIASGDDMLLMRKISRQYPAQVAFLRSPDVIVQTQPAHTWKAFFSQRIRWASKAGRYQDVRISSVLLLVYLVNVAAFILLAGSIWNTGWLLFFTIVVFYKTVIEWRFATSVLAWFNIQKIIPLFPLFQPFHILYTVIAGFLGIFKKYEWKGRTVR